MKNIELSRIFEQIAKILKIKEENPFKIRAYEKITLVLENLPIDIETIYHQGGLNNIPGVGTGIAKKIEEFLTTGKLEYYEKLKETIPSGVIELLDISEVGPKTAKLLYEELGVDNIEKLEKAVKEHRIKDLPGMGEKSETNILRGIELYKRRKERFLLGRALPLAEEMVESLSQLKETDKISFAGSLRRKKETIGDIDILITSQNPEKIMRTFTSLPQVREILAEGPTKSSIITKDDLHIDVRVVEPISFGAALQYFTGSKAHNIKLRELALKRGLKINEYGVFEVESGNRIAGEKEEEVYQALNLPFIPPELREDRGEIEAAQEKKLPQLIEYSQIRGDLHLHTKWSDGAHTIRQMAEAAKKRGYKYIAITDHSQSLKIAGGLTEKRLREQMEEIQKLNQELKDFTILSGIEVDIKSDGSLDFSDEMLSKLDVVIAAIHSGFKQESKIITERIIKAMQNRLVNILAHPTGRLIGFRESYQVDMNEMIKVAAETGTILEINAYPERLDLNDVYCRMAKDKGVQLAIETDAHSIDGLEFMNLGVDVARRGWLEEKDIVNTLPLNELLKRLKINNK
ncbi:MAG: DNA polymerase III [Candidatus Infernicultor aquiphilus]|uniref:DNA polymerase beta n=3 Tax=Candidatus Infernicultor aquiphilus TaxID=1805029 RepID=A0A2M7PS14_9BACT|nr:MAG: DNA polymerase III [Candidatus Atribacteria bacterium CG_4_10_14_3_um_filter_34_13]